MVANFIKSSIPNPKSPINSQSPIVNPKSPIPNPQSSIPSSSSSSSNSSLLASNFSPIYFTSNDATLLKAFTTTDSESGITSLHLKPLKRGEQYVMARLGGATGPLLAMRKVWEFTLDTPALDSVIINAETGIGTTTLTMRPLAPNVDFNFEMAGHTGTFAGGAKSFTVNTPAAKSSIGEPGFQAVRDEATDETIGKFEFAIEMPANEDAYCFTLQATAAREVVNSARVSSRGDKKVF